MTLTPKNIKEMMREEEVRLEKIALELVPQIDKTIIIAARDNVRHYLSCRPLEILYRFEGDIQSNRVYASIEKHYRDVGWNTKISVCSDGVYLILKNRKK